MDQTSAFKSLGYLELVQEKETVFNLEIKYR